MSSVMEQDEKCSVKGKIKCIFQPRVVQSTSGKRNDQMYKVVASEQISPDFECYMNNEEEKCGVYASEKLDGTCCYIREFHGRPWLWARHDIKANKPAEKRFKAYQHAKNEHAVTNQGDDEKFPPFEWDMENDFKEAPDDWIAASGASREDATPDDIGHIVGWVPVDPSLRQHLWHLSAVNLNDGTGLFLYDGCRKQEGNSTGASMELQVDDLQKHCGKTFELIGTHVNANPYKLGCKKSPIHMLVQHGEFKMAFPMTSEKWSHESLKAWFDGEVDGMVEGVVWHAQDGKMFKLHRHHLDLKWPLNDLRMLSRSLRVDLHRYEGSVACRPNALFEKLKTVDGKSFDNIDSLSKWLLDSC